MAQAPVLLTRVPVRNAVAVSLNSIIRLTFSQPMSAQAASVAGIAVASNLRGRVPGTYSGAGTPTVVFTPSQRLVVGERIDVTVTAQVTSQAGIAMANRSSYSFLTAASGGSGSFPGPPEVPLATI
nr:Ig-like domain-containing protein [Hymenobacter terricola]